MSGFWNYKSWRPLFRSANPSKTLFNADKIYIWFTILSLKTRCRKTLLRTDVPTPLYHHNPTASGSTTLCSKDSVCASCVCACACVNAFNVCLGINRGWSAQRHMRIEFIIRVFFFFYTDTKKYLFYIGRYIILCGQLFKIYNDLTQIGT